jgi:hypothetical protein
VSTIHIREPRPRRCSPNVTETEIHAELSLPDSMVDGYIDTWIERLILPPIPLDQAPGLTAAQPAADPDVRVARRTA